MINHAKLGQLILMNLRTETKFANPVHVSNNKDRLYNAFVDATRSYMPFPAIMADQEVVANMRSITNALWFMDGRKKQILDRRRKEPQHIKTDLPDRYITC